MATSHSRRSSQCWPNQVPVAPAASRAAAQRRATLPSQLERRRLPLSVGGWVSYVLGAQEGDGHDGDVVDGLEGSSHRSQNDQARGLAGLLGVHLAADAAQGLDG